MLKGKSTSDILMDVLTIIDYPDDKEGFIDGFFARVQKQAIINVVYMLPKEKREKLEKSEENKELFAEIFTSEVMDNAVSDATVIEFEDFLQSVIPNITSEKKAKLTAYLNSLSPKEKIKN